MSSWDKDVLRKDYIGEIALPVEDWFKDGVVGFDDEKNAVPSLLSNLI
jgi:phosphatidylserine decarboxylase